jgi:hypothetical protein
MTTTVELLELGSLFLHVATPDDIEHERQQMEAVHQRRLEVHQIETVCLSGTRCSRVTWRCL